MSVETNPHNYTNMNLIFSQFVARPNFAKKESRSPRGFLPRPLLRAGESIAPPPLPQKNSGGAHHFRFRFLDLCIRFGKIISKACPVGNLFSFGVCEGFNSEAKKLDTNSDFEDDDCEVCKLMKTGNVAPEVLEKAFSLQNFLNNFPKDLDKKK